MEEIQFSNQENQVNFIPDAPKEKTVTPPVIIKEKTSQHYGKLAPWILGVGLALIGGTIFYKINFNQKNILDGSQVRKVENQVSRTNLITEEETTQNNLVASTRTNNIDTIVGNTVLSANQNSTLQARQLATVAPVTTSETSGTKTTKGGLATQAAAAETANEKIHLSGVVKVNGTVPEKSSILVLYRVLGSSNFIASSRISASNNSTWSLDLPIGKTYEVKLAWQVDEDNYLVSETVTLTESSKITTTFNIKVSNTSYNSSKPWNPTIDTCGTLSDNKWSARLVLPKFADNIVSYHVQIGTTDGNNNILDHVYDQTERVVFTQALENDKEYYIHYQVKIGNKDSNWSDWSNMSKIKCKN